MSVFVDTSAFYAIANADDVRHESAVSVWRSLIDDGELIVTSNYVIVETTALLQNRHGVPAVANPMENLLSVVLAHWVDAPLHSAAASALVAAEGKGSPSLVNCVSFEIIRQLKVDGVFAYDRHFAGRGFKMVGKLRTAR